MGLKPRTGGLFSRATFEFLAELTAHNDRDWFEANKQRYDDQVREPALELIRRMRPVITAISKHFEAIDKKVGGSLMRVHRDTRFSADKTPYKTNIGIQFRHAQGKDVHAPGFYLHVALDGCFAAAGSYRPDSESLSAIRGRIVEEPDAWVAVRDAKPFSRHFELRGDSLKRLPRGFTEDDPHPDDLRRKDFIAVTELDLDDVIGPKLVELCGQRFTEASSYVEFLTRAINAPF